MAAKLAVVVVTYNSAATIERCLESLAEAVKGLDASVVVVDNASRDTTLEEIKDQKSKIKNLILIENTKNVGFAKAVNQGVAQLDATRPTAKRDPSTRLGMTMKDEFILLLNPDTEIEGDVIRRTIDWMGAHPEVGVAGPVMVNSDGSVQNSVRRFPTVWVILGMMLKLHKVFPNWRVFREYFIEDEKSEVRSWRMDGRDPSTWLRMTVRRLGMTMTSSQLLVPSSLRLLIKSWGQPSSSKGSAGENLGEWTSVSFSGLKKWIFVSAHATRVGV